MQHKSTRLNRRHFFGALFAAALGGCAFNGTPINTGENNTELTKNMQPVCVGRFAFEIPTLARIKRWSQNLDNTRIETVSPPSLNKHTFDAKITQRETQLKSSPHKTGGVLFSNKIQLTPESKLLVHRADRHDNFLYKLDALFWRPALEIKFHTETTDKYLENGIARISKVVKSFSPVPTWDITHPPAGLCIEKGVITGRLSRGSEVAVSLRIDQYPGVTFSFYTKTKSKPHEDPTLEPIVRPWRFYDPDLNGKMMTDSTKFLRKGQRELNGQKGEETVAVTKIDGETTREANAEFYPDPKTLDEPSIKVSLSDKTHDDNTHKPYPKNLTQEEFLALWDALLNGIKLRPGAP